MGLDERNKRILYVAGPAVVLALILIILASCGVFSPTSGASLSPGLKCISDECKDQATRITNYARFDVDPCEDFNEFTCGKYTPPSDAIYSSIQTDEKRLLRDKVNLALDEALKKDNESDFESVQYIKFAYRKCVEEKTDYSNLRAIRNQMLIKDSLEDKVAFISSLGQSVILHVDVQPDPDIPSKNILWLSPPEFGIEPEILSRARLEGVRADDTANKIKEQYIRHMNHSMSLLLEDHENYYDEITQAVDFESSLASMSLVQSGTKFKDLITRTTVKGLQDQMGSEFNIYNFLNSLRISSAAKYLFQTYTPIIVKNINYFKNLDKKLTEVRGKNALTPYLSMRLVKSLQYLVDTKSIGLEGTLQLNEKEDVSPSGRCLDVLRSNAPMVLGHVYVKQASPVIGVDDLQEVWALVRHVNSSLKQFIGNSTWVNEADKAVLMEKVEKVKVNVGYPDWLDKEDKLKETTYLEKPQKDAHAVTLITEMQKSTLVHKLDSISNDVNGDIWPLSPAAVDVNYNLASNSLTIPAAILHAPFFDAKVTFYLNYAALGVEVAKNLLKALGRDGVDFSSTGQLKITLSEDFLTKHSQRVKCYVDAYKDINFEHLQNQVDSEKTLDENMADNEAFKVAHFAFKNSNFLEGLRLPSESLEKFTDDQLFFISYGSSRCHHLTTNSLYIQLTSGEAAPLANRTFVSLKNYKNFTQANDCQKGSKYVPDEGKICSIWL